MSKVESKTIEQLLAEADDLMQRINSGLIEGIKGEHRVQLEKDTQRLGRLKSEVHAKIEANEISKSAPYSEGMHQAMDDIVKAMEGMASYLT